MALKKIRAWTTEGKEFVFQVDVPAVLPGGIPTPAEYIRTQLIYADEMAQVFSYGLNGGQEPPGEYVRLGNVQRFRILEPEE